MDEFMYFWKEVDPQRFVRLFWYFVIFEFTRYLFLDYFVLVLYFIKRKREATKREEARRTLFYQNPLVSIIIPGKNEGENYYNLVRSLKEQSYTNYEIILVDDGSDDNSRLIGRDLERNGMIDLFLSNDFRGGKASAANLAHTYSKGEYVVHLDADCSFDYDAIENILIPFFMDPEVGGVAGDIGVRNSDASLAATLQTIEYAKNISVGRIVTSYLDLLRIISGAFGAFRKDLLDRIGGWDVGPGLDGDITMKLRKMGFKIAFEPEARCLTNVPTSFVKLAKQRQRWNKSLIRFRLRKHTDVFVPNKGFSLRNMLSSLENIVFNLVLDVSWVVYLVDMLLYHQSLFLTFILPMNFVIYTIFNTLQLLVYVLIMKNSQNKLSLFIYTPLMSMYTGMYLRFVRTIAYFKETFFFSSYKDPWNPEKSSKIAEEMRI